MTSQEILESFAGKISGRFSAAVGFVDEHPITLNADAVFPAASLIKIPILIYLLKARETGNINLLETYRLKKEDKVGGSGILFELHDDIPLTWLDIATLMIVVSDNTATNLLMERLGTGKIQKWNKENGLSKTILARKMMIAPNAPPANFTSALDMFVLFQKLALGSLLNAENTGLALDILSRQQYNEKIPLLLPKDIKIAHKTGEINGVRHDCGIIMQGKRPYAICFLTKEVSDEPLTDRRLAEASLELYDANVKGGG